MLLISCVWCLALLCHLISLDMLCVNATCSVSNYHIREHCHLVASHYICELYNALLLQKHYICELCNALLFSQPHVCELDHAIIFLYYVFHLSTTFVYSTILPVHQPFELVMGKSRVKTRSSEQLVLPVDADFLLVTDSSSEEDSERDDQSYSPPLRGML